MEYDEYIEKSKKILNRFLFLSNKFCEEVCNLDGLPEILLNLGDNEDSKINPKVSYDYDYFAFAKGTKTLYAIRELLNADKAYSEDVFVLVRSILENHIFSRYVREHIDNKQEIKKVIYDTIVAPVGTVFSYYVYDRNFKTSVDKDGNIIGKNPSPYSIVSPNDRTYYSCLYGFLSRFAHCNFSVILNYIDDDYAMFNIDKKNDILLAYVVSIFAFTKLYEGVVTVNGEDLGDRVEERKYYDVCYDSLEYQNNVLDFLIDYYTNKLLTKNEIVIQAYASDIEKGKNMNDIIVIMLSRMKESLNDDDLSSLNKSVFSDGKYERFYPEE